MRVFTVHLRRHGLDVDRDLALVKEGFCWPAFLFSFLWALWHRLWIVAIAIFSVEAALSWALAAFASDPVSWAAVSLGVAVIIGNLANDLRRWALARQEFADAGVVAADDRDSAERRFLESRPELAAELRAAMYAP